MLKLRVLVISYLLLDLFFLFFFVLYFFIIKWSYFIFITPKPQNPKTPKPLLIENSSTQINCVGQNKFSLPFDSPLRKSSKE